MVRQQHKPKVLCSLLEAAGFESVELENDIISFSDESRNYNLAVTAMNATLFYQDQTVMQAGNNSVRGYQRLVGQIQKRLETFSPQSPLAVKPAVLQQKIQTALAQKYDVGDCGKNRVIYFQETNPNVAIECILGNESITIGTGDYTEIPLEQINPDSPLDRLEPAITHAFNTANRKHKKQY